MADLPIPEPHGFSDLAKTEQIRYLQALWDRIAEQPGDLPPPAYVEWLRTFDSMADPKPTRRAQNEAVLFGSHPALAADGPPRRR